LGLLVLVAFGGYLAFSLIPWNGGDEQRARGLFRSPVPSEEDFRQIDSLKNQAAQELVTAKAAGDRETVDRLRQNLVHYKTTLSHARKMRQAFLEMEAAEKAGDYTLTQSKAHSYRHYSGQLILMKESAKSLPSVLQRKIHEWTGE